MSESLSGDQVLQEYIDKMGEKLGRLFSALSNELIWMHWYWHQQVALFADKPTRVEVLNNSAPFFFHIVQRSLFEGTLLAIARMVGPRTTFGHENLAVRALLPLIGDKRLRAQIGKAFGAVEKKAKFATDWRHGHIAHRDLERALGSKTAVPLPTVRRQEVDDVLADLASLLNVLDRKYRDVTTMYNHHGTPGDADSLLHVLQMGLLRQRDRDAKWDQGKDHEDDLNPPDPL